MKYMSITIKKLIISIKSSKGQSLVEFALVAPILIIIVLGIVEFGNLWLTMNTMSGAAREGVRIAAVTAPDVEQVENVVQNYLTASNINDATITVAGPNAANEVVVTVQMTYNPIFLGLLPGMDAAFQITRSATMHWES
jgi:Flp pilus assembly protein TadG